MLENDCAWSEEAAKLSQFLSSENHAHLQSLHLTEQEDMAIVLTRRRWTWIGQVLRRKSTNISRVALDGLQRVKRKEAARNSPGGGLLRQNSSLWALTGGKFQGLLWTYRNGGYLLMLCPPLGHQHQSWTDLEKYSFETFSIWTDVTSHIGKMAAWCSALFRWVKILYCILSASNLMHPLYHPCPHVCVNFLISNSLFPVKASCPHASASQSWKKKKRNPQRIR